MSSTPFVAGDWHRILIGDAPWLFLLELVGRVAVVYLLLILFMRLMGKRLASQMSTVELAVILTLGAAVSLPVQSQEQGILLAVMTLIAGLIFQRGISYIGFVSPRAELWMDGDAVVLVRDGRVQHEVLRSVQLSTGKLFAALRSQGVEQLGELRRVYLENTGAITLLRYRRPRPGLSVYPAIEGDRPPHVEVGGHYVCGHCGEVLRADPAPEILCTLCYHCGWRAAVLGHTASRSEAPAGGEPRLRTGERSGSAQS